MRTTYLLVRTMNSHARRTVATAIFQNPSPMVNMYCNNSLKVLTRISKKKRVITQNQREGKAEVGCFVNPCPILVHNFPQLRFMHSMYNTCL